MAQMLFPMVLIFGCIICLQVHDASAQYFPSDANTQSVRITNFGSPYDANSFSSNIQPSSFGTSSNQQLISNNFPSTSNAVSTSSATASYNFLPSPVPNAFTNAVLAIPSLQRFLTLQIPRYQAADLVFNVVNKVLTNLGHPTPATVANLVGHHVSRLPGSFTLPVYFQLKGNTFEKFLTVLGVDAVPSLAQSFANSVENSLNSSTLDSDEALFYAIQYGYANFVQSLGFNFVEKAYILGLVFHEEIAAALG